MTTRFLPLPGTPDGVKQMLDCPHVPLMIVSLHGLGDNVFFSPCFVRLREIFGRVFFTSAVNAYTSMFHESELVEAVYCGSVNGADLGLNSAEGFARHFERMKLDLGCPDVQVYHFGLFEPHLPYHDERAFVKGRRNFVELFGTGPGAVEMPRYHVAPDRASKSYVDQVLDRWLDGRELICIARYGHTDGGKNFGDDSRESLQMIDLVNRRWPDRFKFVVLDYVPGGHAADGRAANVRSVYGFLPCDAASMHHLLSRACAFVTVPSGPMLVGATIGRLRMLTLWKTMAPYHFLDPQCGGRLPVRALVARGDLADTSFMTGWPVAAREAVLARWRLRLAPIDHRTAADELLALVEEL
ncbi:MAG TPA: hypothetical protein VNH11_33895 [Pirellulales bacterium]|nr:hypothetical protein [Pirellulales bacterium]